MKHARRILLGTVTALFIQSCAPEKLSETTDYQDQKADASSNVIYGTDGRLDVYQVSDDQLKRLADSTVALVKSKNITVNGNTIVFKAQSFAEYMGNLCSTEKYREQNTDAFCSGSLVGEDTIITAGHCITSAATCADTSFVFGYAVKTQGVLPKTAPASEVYRCASIIKQVYNNSADYAVIKLDRKVTNHAILKIRPHGEASVGDGLVVIGHPSGLPTKITTGGKVRSVANAEYLVASVDTYGGNSGSAVFNSQTGLIEGILVRGEQDFKQTSAGCIVSNVCTEDSCRGEDITRISLVRPFIPAAVAPVPTPTPAAGSRYSVIANLSIPDNSTAGIKSTLTADKAPGSLKVVVTLDISHPHIGDLIVVVRSPSGKVAVLHSRAGGSTDNIKKSFDVTSKLGSETQAGIYQVSVQDIAARDVGFLNSWTLEFK